VVGCDQDERALGIARARADADHLNNVELRLASFENLDLAGASFETAVSRFGVLMFGGREAGARELARVLAPGAPYALALWSAPDDNPYLRLGLRTIERVLGSLEGLPDMAAPFSALGSTSTVLSWLTGAGMTTAESDWFDWDAEFPDIESACHYLMTAGGPLAGFYAALSDEQREKARTVQAELVAAEQASSSGVGLRSRCRIVSGAR
jgi:SAM-dependent methyltransferase